MIPFQLAQSSRRTRRRSSTLHLPGGSVPAEFLTSGASFGAAGADSDGDNVMPLVPLGNRRVDRVAIQLQVGVHGIWGAEGGGGKEGTRDVCMAGARGMQACGHMSR